MDYGLVKIFENRPKDAGRLYEMNPKLRLLAGWVLRNLV